jgi:hypothetical protein
LVDFVDVEHWLCKVYLYLKVLTPGYEAREFPKNSSVCCRPFITHDKRLCIKEDQALFLATIRAKEAFIDFAGEGLEYEHVKEMPPDVFLVPDEIMRFTEAYQSKQHEEEWLNELFAK